MSSKPRSRSGCENCRLKHIKCDEAKPKCSRCSTRNLHCNYTLTLQFREDVERKGRKFGREGVWYKNGASKRALSSSNSLVSKSKSAHYERLRRSQLRFINTFYRDFQSAKIPISLQLSIIPNDIINSIDGDFLSLSFALNYYVSFISPILNPLGSETVYLNHLDNNKYIVIEKGLDLTALIQYSQREQHLFYLILALGSIYLSKLVNGDAKQVWIAKAQKFQQMAINSSGGSVASTPRQIESMDPTVEDLGDDYELSSNQSAISVHDQLTPQPQSSSANSQTLLSYVLLILYELANDCNLQWTVYLKLSKNLIHNNDFIIPHNSIEYSLLKFGLEFLDYHEAIGRTACKDTNSFFLKYEDEGMANNDPSGSPAPIKLVSWIGCDRNLLSILQDITDLSFEKEKSGVSTQDYQSICETIRQRIELQNLNVLDPLLDIANVPETASTKSFMDSRVELMISDHGNTEEFCYLLACELKRLAAVIYFECCLLDKTPEDPEISKLVKVIFKVLEILVLKNDFKWYATLIWTVYIASCEISHWSEDCEELRYLSLEVLEKIEGQSLGNVNRTREMILNIWRKRDLEEADEKSFGSLKNTKRVKNSISHANDWDTYVVDKDCRLSMG
ncbi:uncharacterized protein CANTADRAFT_91992 [Suhomyces tanzawaensis NRRL Y-17324]|uniref:Zn(2)-C6 fungal-type domain-containing protein n=1 Tax=Suhomyces tanzawaensis NRRL Y-17324 TaxID=984487 RepID=A0A1E4SDH2_9ASCO|nr:uncharacterized protein CANTADRAFT_91992 [Suhomyces tanzawaensis NRRL Y-17324]ODV77564.1 hypothetical protein CANTADRAFT_91992 [Suhomyces tanzawaensis NRRL Y-17324]